VADETHSAEMAEDFKAALLDVGFDYLSFDLSFLLDVYRFI
jgi:hypothetical protein